MTAMAVKSTILVLLFLILDFTQGYRKRDRTSVGTQNILAKTFPRLWPPLFPSQGGVTQNTPQCQPRNNDDLRSVQDLLNESLRIHRSNSNTLSDMGRLLRLVEELTRDMDEMKTNPANDCVKETTFNNEAEELRKQLEAKDKQMEELIRQLEAKDKQTEELIRQLEAKDRKVLEETRNNAVLETKLLHEGEKVIQLTRENEDLTTKFTNEAKQVTDLTRERETLKIIVADKSQKVEALTRENDVLKTQQADECNQDASHIDKIVDLKKQLGDKEKQVMQLTRENEDLTTKFTNEAKQVESLERSLKESQKEVEELTKQVNNACTSDTNSKQPPKCEPPEQSIKEKVDAYSRTKNWDALRRDLGGLLSYDSEAYKQLMGVRSGYPSPLFEVVHRGYTELVTLLLCHGLPADTAGSNKFTMLHASAMTGQVELMQLLIQHGADINAKDNSGRTAIMKAEDEGRWTVVDWLLRNGAKSSTLRRDDDSGVIINGRAKCL